jgi:oligogalacturonide transporter
MDKKISLGTKLMYASGEICGGGAYLIISLLFLIYLTDIVHLPPFLAGTLILTGKIWDAFIDPTIGYISDHTVSRFGRRRKFILIGFIPLFITYSLIWNQVHFQTTLGLFLYYLLLYLLFNTAFSTLMIPFYALNADMTSDYKERTSISGFRMIFSSVASIFCGVLPTMIIHRYTNAAQGYRVMGIIFATIFSAIWLLVFYGTHGKYKEKIVEDTEKLNIFKSVRTVYQNKSFRVQIGMFLCSMAAVDFLSTLFLYYLTYCLNRSSEYPALMATLIIVQVIFLPIHMAVSKKKGKVAPFKIGLTVWTIAMVLAFFTYYLHGAIYIYLVAFLSGIGTASAYLVPWSIIPELTDVDEMMSTKKRQGMYYGMVEFMRQLALALTVFIIGAVLQWSGYLPGVAQNSMTKTFIHILFTIIPIAFIGLGIFFSTRYNMTEEKYKILKAEIERRRSNGKSEDVDMKTQMICEELSGMPYKKLWDKML